MCPFEHISPCGSIFVKLTIGKMVIVDVNNSNITCDYCRVRGRAPGTTDHQGPIISLLHILQQIDRQPIYQF